MRAAFRLMVLAGTVAVSSQASAADLPLRIRPVVHRKDSLTPGERRRLFERFSEYLRERRSN
jgi:hypothetical protein